MVPKVPREPLPPARRALDEVFDVRGRTMVVTGAASGLGLGVARGLIELGATVAAVDRDAAGLEAAFHEESHAAMTFTCDLTAADQVEATFRSIASHLGPIDALIHFAGIAGPLAPIQALGLEDWDHVIRTNLTSAFLVVRSCVPHMTTRTTGKIVLTSSTWGIVGSRTVPVSAYAASKAGIIGLSMQLATELAPQVCVNTIVPAGVRSAIADGFYEDPSAVANLISHLPVQQVRDPETLLGLTVLLATSASDHMTGSVIAIDGGYLAH